MNIISVQPWYTHELILLSHDITQTQGDIYATLVIAQRFTRSCSGLQLMANTLASHIINSLIILAWPCTFLIQPHWGAQRYLSCYGGANSILVRSDPILCFKVHPETAFITIQLWSSVWQPQNASLHIVRNNDDLRSEDPAAGIPLENTWWHILT